MSMSYEEVVSEFPELFPRGSTIEGVGIGWVDIVHKCMVLLRDHNSRNPESAPVIPSQIKEKFGGLRIYCRGSWDQGLAMVMDEVISLSGITCESCGSTHHVQTRPNRGKHWVKTRCGVCRKSEESKGI